MPALEAAERAFSAALARISVEELTHCAETLRKGAEHPEPGDHKSWREAI